MPPAVTVTGNATVRSGQLTLVPLTDPGGLPVGVSVTADGHLAFAAAATGWWTVELEADWGAGAGVDGSHRFVHTASTSTVAPVHTESVDASVLEALTGGVQRLRANVVTGPGHLADLRVEAWHDDAPFGRDDTVSGKTPPVTPEAASIPVTVTVTLARMGAAPA